MTKDLYTLFLGDEVVLGDFGKLPSAVVCVGNEAVRYVPERTCRPELKGFDPNKAVNTCHYACSECFYPIDQNDSYCRSCGAKVVD